MSEVFTNKEFDKRVKTVLGKDPNQDVGFTDDELHKLAVYGVFDPDARGPWTPDTPIPALREQLARLMVIQSELQKTRENFRELKLKNWASGMNEMIEILNQFIRPLQEKVKRDSQR